MPNCPPCPRCHSNMTYLDNNVSYACTKCGERWDINPRISTVLFRRHTPITMKNKIIPKSIKWQKDKEILKKLFYDGMAYADIAEYLKVSVMAVTQVVFKMKLKRTKKKRNNDWGEIDTFEFKRLVRKGRTTIEIARKLNFTVAAIREAKKHIKVKVNK